MNSQYGTVEAITFIRSVMDGVDLCEIRIDFDEVKIFYNKADLNIFLNKRVEYTTREDIYNGECITVICQIAELYTIQTVPTTENIKLIPEGTSRTVCNLSTKDIIYGEYYKGVIALLSSYTLGASAKTKWVDYKMVDKDSKEFNVKQFVKLIESDETIDALVSSMVGMYCQFDMEVSRFGYQTKECTSLSIEVEISPEVTVAKEIILKELANDEGLASYDKTNNLVEELTYILDGEPGYALVRIASEIFMINAIDNISTDLDITAMKRAAICSRTYLLPKNTKWSRPMLNTNRVLRNATLKKDKELLLILDALSEEKASSTKVMYIKIKGLVNDIINIRRGVIDEEINSSYAGMLSSFNGLL